MSKIEHKTFYILKAWDGGDGRSNRSIGVITEDKELAETWKRLNTGADYQTIKGHIAKGMGDIKAIQSMNVRTSALSKLNDAEIKELGLTRDINVTTF